MSTAQKTTLPDNSPVTAPTHLLFKLFEDMDVFINGHSQYPREMSTQLF
jgi:hypothetical protein